MSALSGIVAVFAVCAATAVVAALTNRRVLFAVTKPLTTALLFVVVGLPQSGFARLIDLGIAFSLAGDVALLLPAKNAFLLGLAIFLGAHIAYISAFLGVAGLAVLSPPAAVAALVTALVTGWVLRRLWPRAAGIRVPLVIYACALGTMVVTAVAAVASSGGELPSAVALGAAMFYVGDASLALDRFDKPIKYAPLLTLGVYWLGQLAIALGARVAPF